MIKGGVFARQVHRTRTGMHRYHIPGAVANLASGSTTHSPFVFLMDCTPAVTHIIFSFMEES